MVPAANIILLRFVGAGVYPPPSQVKFQLQKKSKTKIVEGIFSMGNFSLEGGGILPQNSYKPSQDLWELA